jgi:hypothetical protein
MFWGRQDSGRFLNEAPGIIKEMEDKYDKEKVSDSGR